MCGIAGYYGTHQIEEKCIKHCLSLMKRRGPDNQSYKYWIQENGKHVYFLHSRLDILDLDPRSNQPFHIGSYWIIFNGELYNYREIKEILKSLKVSFSTESDTEVLLASFIFWGEKALDRFEGMWAFAVFNESDGTLLLCRDRFGEKPLYLFHDGEDIYFASEIKFIQALSGKKFTLNEMQVYRYILNGYKSLYKGTDTFFEEISELKPGHYLHYDPDGKIKISQYWSLCYNPDNSMDYTTAVDGVKNKLIRSVGLRLRSDVPIAFCMSGGIDSNALISIARRIFNYNVHGFTVVNTDHRYDEQEMVTCAVKELGIRHTSVPIIQDNFFENLQELIRYHDVPIYTISYYVQWLLMREVARYGYRVSVSGTGADELLTGYYDHHLLFLKEIFDDKEHFSAALSSWKKHIEPFVRNPFLKDPYLFVHDPSFRDHIYLDFDLFQSYLQTSWNEPFFEEFFSSDLLRNRMLNELFHESIPVILHEDDLNAMYYSIENRSPFLDRELSEFCYKIPTRYLINNGMTKAILRDAMRGIVPDKILDNYRKVGFNAPIESFMKNEEIERYVRQEKGVVPFDSIIRSNIVEGEIPNSMSKFLFNLINIRIFSELHGCEMI